MTPPLLAACIVVTDEITDLQACLDSAERLRPLLGEVCVYGVGAQERVLEVARQAGASVASGVTETDLGTARNRAAAMTNATWVLVLRGDETVTVAADRLARLLAVEPGMMAQPDAMSVQVQPSDPEMPSVREARLYRSAVARFAEQDTASLVPVAEGRRLTTLTPGRDVIAVNGAGGETSPAGERARLERRLARADAQVSSLERGGVAGDDLVTALVTRARVLRELDEDNAALSDLTRARRTRATRSYRWRARQDLASLLIKHGHYAGAETVIGELERDECDTEYISWLRAQASAARGQAREALEVLRGLDEVVAADGRRVSTPAILNERMVMAARVGEFDEALDCCVQLVAVHGQSRRYARMLLKLWGGRSARGLADKLVAAGGLHQHVVADALAAMPEPGPAVAQSLLDPAREEKPMAVRVM